MPPRQSASAAGAGVKPANPLELSPRARRMSTRTAAASGTQVAGKRENDKDVLEVEDFGPPAWRSVLNLRADLGWPDFYPSRPGFGQPEDVLTEENVKNGFMARDFMASMAGGFSAHTMIFHFICAGGLDVLSRVGQEVMEQRDQGMPQLGERLYKPPPRVTYNETRRSQFFAEASNPAVPLARLHKDRIPHGYKTLDALDAIFAPPVPVTPAAKAAGQSAEPAEPFPLDRAVWFLRALGVNEVMAHRLRQWPAGSLPAAPATSALTPGSAGPATLPPGLGTGVQAPSLQTSNEWYAVDFTTTFTTWLKTQLQLLVLPTADAVSRNALAPAPRPAGLTVRSIGGVLSDEKSRTRWLQKWEYSCALLKELHMENLVSPRILLGWLADQVTSSNLAQLGFVLQVVNEYLLDIVNHLSLARLIVRGACQRIKEIGTLPAPETLARLDAFLRSIIQTLCATDIDVLLSPPLWRQHADLIQEVCAAAVADHTEIQTRRERSEKLLYTLAVVESDSSPRRSQMDELSKLDSIAGETDMAELCRSFFDAGASPTAPTIDEAKLEDKVFMVLNWSMGLRNLGIHRPYGAYTLLRVWAEQREEYLSNRHAAQHKNGFHRSAPASFVPDLFPVLYKWLDTAPAAKKQRNVQAIGITFGEFTRQGLFSYSRYMQTLIAYGETARARPNGPRSHHLDLLRAMPIFVEANDLLEQRRLALSGDSHEQRWRDEAEERAAIMAFKEECKEYVPELYGFKTYGRSAEYRNEIDHQMASTVDMTRFVFLQARFELAENSEKRLGKKSMTSSAFVRVLQILHLSQGYSSIADFLVRGLRLNHDLAVLRCILDTIRRHADVFTAMERWPRLITALWNKFRRLDKREKYHPRICRLLLDLAAAGKLSADDAQEVHLYLEDHRQQWLGSIPAGNDVSPTLPAISNMISTGNLYDADRLGVEIYGLHGPFEAWDKQWWDTIVAALNLVAAAGDQAKLDAALRAAGAHIDRVTEYLALELDEVVIRWLDAFTRKKQVESLNPTGPLTRLILILVTRRRLSTVTVLNHLLYPLWKQLAPIAMNPATHLNEAQLHAVESSIVLMEQLFLTRPPHQNLPPHDQEEALIAQTSRAEVFTNHRTPDLIRHLPLLVVLGSSTSMPDSIRAHVRSFFDELSLIPAFKTAIFRHLPSLKDAFLTSDWSRPGIDPGIETGLVEILKGMMSETLPSERSDSRRNSLQSLASLSASGTRLSAWRWTSIVLEMRVEFKRLADRIGNSFGSAAADAQNQLRTLIGDSLNKRTSADDADLLCETFRGIDTVVKVEVLSVGLETLVGLLRQMEAAGQQEELGRAEKGIGFVLRIMDAALSAEASAEMVVQAAKLRLLDALAGGFTAVERKVKDLDKLPQSEDPAQAKPEQGVVLRVLLELLRFALGLGPQDSVVAGVQRSPPEFSRLVTALLKVIVALHHAERYLTDELLDMLSYVIDVAPSNARAGIHTSLINEMASPGFDTALQSLPALEDILPVLPEERDLHIKSTVADTEMLLPMDERSWELFDYLGQLPCRRRHRDQYLAHKDFIEQASIPAGLFNPLIKRDALPGKESEHAGHDVDEGDADGWLDYVAERNLGDGDAGEPLAGRFIATGAYAGPDDLEIGTMGMPSMGSLAGTPNVPRDMLDLTNFSPSTASTTSSVPLTQAPRRQSTRIAMHAAGGSGTNNDPIAVDDDDNDNDKAGQSRLGQGGTGTTNQDEDDSSDSSSEEETRRKPPAKRPRVGGKAPAKRTAGKAPARKTVAGKAVARKGGKSVKGLRR